MNKRIFLAAAMLFFSVVLTAQYKPMLFGLRAGGSIDWMKPDATGYNGEGARPGFSWGFIADFFLMENYSIQTGFNVQYLYGELSYPDMAINDGDTTMGVLNRNFRLQYIQVPVVLKMQAELSEKVRLFGKIGLGTGFRLRAKAQDSFAPESGSVVVSERDIADEISLIRESFLVGGGFSYVLKGSTALIVDLTFDNGFVDILKGTNSVNPEIKQKAVMNLVELGIGIVF